MKKYLALAFLPIILIGCSTNQNSSLSENNIPSSSISSEDTSHIADVIILSGQSNAEGHTYINELEKTASTDDFGAYQIGYDYTLINFVNNGGSYRNNYFDPVALGQGFTNKRFGPEVGIAKALEASGRTKTTYIIKYTLGGSALYDRWRSPSSLNDGTTGDQYPKLVEHVHEALSQIEFQDLTPVIRGICWMQGEADATNATYTQAYYNYLEAFVSDLRDEFSEYAPKDGIAFVDAGISNCSTWTYHQLVNKAKLDYANSNPETNYYFDTMQLGLQYHKEPVGSPDLFHYDSLSMIKLGEEFAKVFLDNQLIKVEQA